MIARLQRVITFVVALLALLAGTVLYRAGHPWWAAIALLLVSSGHALVLAGEFVAMHRANARDPAPRARIGQVMRAWLGEAIAAPIVFCWRQPFRSRAVADHLPPGATRRGVVLVHGFVCNRGIWNPWMRQLRARDIPFAAVDLEPVFGSIDRYAAIVEAAVTRVTAATGMPPVVVGHSMGGLAIRAWLASASGTDARVHRIVTIGSPHGGTRLADVSATQNGHEMRIGGPWLTRLSAREPAARYERFVCFFGHCDNIVFPARTATLAGADNRHLAGIAHVHMVSHPAVFDEVLAQVASG